MVHDCKNRPVCLDTLPAEKLEHAAVHLGADYSLLVIKYKTDIFSGGTDIGNYIYLSYYRILLCYIK